MEVKKRGLSALLSSTQPVSNQPESAVLANSITTADLALTSVRSNSAQPRTFFDPEALEQLAHSIKARGLIQPIVVRQLKPEEVTGEIRYELIAGERRWRASQIAGLTVVPAVIKQVFDQREILLLSLVENLQRDDLNPVEEALAYQKLNTDFNLTHDQIADGVGKKRASVSNAIRLLELPPAVVEAVRTRKISAAHAKILLSIPNPEFQSKLAAKVQAEHLTTRDLEKLVAWNDEQRKGIQEKTPAKHTKGSRETHLTPAHLQEIEHGLREHFGTRVYVEEGLRKGSITIEFYSVEDFNRIIGLIKPN